MKKVGLICIILFGTFISVWAFKSKTPNGRPTTYIQNETNNWFDKEQDIQVETEWRLDSSIEPNYIPVPGEENLFMVIDLDTGEIKGYRERTLQEDGETYLWKDVNPDIPENYEPVKNIKNLYKVKQPDGSYKYFKYIRNDDDTFAFEETDKKGNLIILKNNKKTEKIPDNYKQEKDNVYSVYNDNNVKIGYVNKTVDKDGFYVWKPTTKPASTNNTITNIKNEQPTQEQQTSVTSNTNQEQSTTQIVVGSGESINTVQTSTDNDDGTRKVTEKYIQQVQQGNYLITYEITTIKIYDKSDKLISSTQGKPKEISREYTVIDEAVPNKKLVKDTLEDEWKRVKDYVTFNTKMADKILSLLNAERVKNDVPSLSMYKGSDAYMLAQIFAAEAATYNTSDYESYLYGTIDNTVAKFNIQSSVVPSKTIWKALSQNATATSINARFNQIESSRKSRMSNLYSNIGIAIAEKNGFYYIVEVYMP